MGTHNFRVGQLVDFYPSEVGVSASGRRYKILRLLPQERGESLYRIKTISEPFVRIAKERELVIAGTVEKRGRVVQLNERRMARASP